MRVCPLSKIYLEQSTITEFISHPSFPAPDPQPITPPGVLPTQAPPALLLLPVLQAQRRGIADSETERREAEARKDVAFNSVDKFGNTATSPRPGAPRARRHRLHRGAPTAVTPMALHETVIGDLNRRMLMRSC